MLAEKASYRKICRDGSRPIRTSGRAQRIKSRQMARGFLAMSCFWQGSTERSRPFPTKQPKGRNHPVRFIDSLKQAPPDVGRSLLFTEIMPRLRLGLRCVGNTQPSVTVMVPILVPAGVLLPNAPERDSSAESLGASSTVVPTAVARSSDVLSKLPMMPS